MVYVTGDLHGEYERFTKTAIRKLRKNDVLFVCGDFGFLWNGGKKEAKILNKIGKKRFHTVFVTGCHDNYALLRQYPEEEWCGGKVRAISGNLKQLCRGEIYTVEGKTFFAFGGGESSSSVSIEDNPYWWPEEQPTPEEEAYAFEKLASVGNRVDYIITHETSVSLCEFLNIPPADVNSRINNFLEKIGKTVEFKQWFFGKFHQDKAITGKQRAVYLQVVPVKES